MRTFIAIEIPDEIKREMAKVQEKLKRANVDASWTRPEGIHLTLKFLGEVPEAKVSGIMDSLVRAVGDAKKFRLETAGAGAFPNAKNARVVWHGLSGELDRLSALQASVEDAMAEIGFEREDRRFSPHLTLARIKFIRSRDAWQNALDEIKDVRLPGFEVGAISLMKSELRREGAVYAEMGRVELK